MIYENVSFGFNITDCSTVVGQSFVRRVRIRGNFDGSFDGVWIRVWILARTCGAIQSLDFLLGLGFPT